MRDQILNGFRLLADNQAAIKMASNPVNHARAKHIDIAYHCVSGRRGGY